MRYFLLHIGLLCFGMFASHSIAGENIRVVIADDLKSVTLRSNRVMDVKGTTAGPGQKVMTFDRSIVSKHSIRVHASASPISVLGKKYRGVIELRTKKNGLIQVINDLDLELYLRGVIAAEIPPVWEMEALKAQAIASRTYALYQKRAAGKKPYHIVATVNDQVYLGVNGEQPRTVRAVQETEGMVMSYQGVVIPAYYHANCGGHTESAVELWGFEAPYLRGVDCECQEIVKDGLWEKRMTSVRVAKALARHGYNVAMIDDIFIAELTPAGRAKKIAIRTVNRIRMVPAEVFREALGSTEIPSVYFEVELLEGEVIFSGRGNGHGVGLCQWGAKEMAEKGHAYQSILTHYYPKITLKKVY